MSDKSKTAVFIGNRDCYFIKEKHIEEAILCAINMGITVFLNGGLGHFDVTCASALHRMKARYPNVKSYLVIPYHGFHIYNKDLFDEIINPFEKLRESYFFYKKAIPERNKVMVEWSSVAISYVYRTGGASRTLDYAKGEGLKIISLIGNNVL